MTIEQGSLKDLKQWLDLNKITDHYKGEMIEYMKDFNSWVCPEHAAAFDLTGNGDNSIFPNAADPTVNNNGLTVYNTELIDESTLRVFS